MTLLKTWTATACAAAIGCAVSGGAIAAPATLYFDFNTNLVAPNASLFLFGNAGQAATVSNQAGFSQNVVLGADGFFSLSIPSAYQQSGTGIRNTGFEVTSSNALAAYFINRASASTDMSYLLDSSALGKNYVVASQGVGFGEGSQIAIHATQDNTAVTLTPKGGAPVNVVLNKGQTYKYAGGGVDLTGSFISADKNVAVFSGHSCAQIPGGVTYCDTLLEQAIPTDKLSKSYLLTASRGAEITPLRSDLVRIIATADNTDVSVNGALVATLNKGQVHEFSISAGAGAKIEASQAVAVAQYLKGGQGVRVGGGGTDPAMSYVPGADTWLDKYRLATPSGASAFDFNWASIVIDTADLGSLKLDGVAVDTSGFTAIGATGFSRGNVDLPLGLFDLTADSKFLVMLGGGDQDDSYYTYGGSTFAPGISPPPAPAPEPASLLLTAVALAGLAASRRRKTTGTAQG